MISSNEKMIEFFINDAPRDLVKLKMQENSKIIEIKNYLITNFDHYKGLKHDDFIFLIEGN